MRLGKKLGCPSLTVTVLTLALLIAGGGLAPSEEAFGVTVPRLLVDGRSAGPWDPAKATVSGSITPSRGQEIWHIMLRAYSVALRRSELTPVLMPSSSPR